MMDTKLTTKKLKGQNVVKAAIVRMFTFILRRAVNIAKKRVSTRGGRSEPGMPPKMITGKLQKSIGYKLDKTGYRGKIFAKVKYAGALEYGTGPIVVKKAKALKIPTPFGGFVFRKSTKGIQPRPFLMSSLEMAMGRLPYRKTAPIIGIQNTKRVKHLSKDLIVTDVRMPFKADKKRNIGAARKFKGKKNTGPKDTFTADD